MKKVLVVLSTILMLTFLVAGVSFSASAETLEEHIWDEGVIETKPTHLQTGVKIFTCTECGETKAEILDKTTTHNFGRWVIVDADKHQKECECGKTTVSTHTWNRGVVTVQATHNETGLITYTCTGCGLERTEIMGTVDYHVYTHCYSHLNGNEHEAVCVCGESITELHDLVLLEDVILYRCTKCGYMPPTWDEMNASSGNGADDGSNASPIWIQKIKDSLGCRSVVSVGSGLMLILSMSAAGILLKKKED